MALPLASVYRTRRELRWRRAVASGRRDYNYFRDYDAATGRYVESDPIALAGGTHLDTSEQLGKMKQTTSQFRVLNKSRRKPRAGDIFAYQLDARPDRYFFGRVIATDTRIGGIRDFDVVLIYLYRTTAEHKLDIPALEISDLLLPPIGTNSLPWARGYFEVVKSNSSLEGKVSQQHSFRNSSGLFLDEYGNQLSGPSEPVGIFGLSGIAGIELRIATALGDEAKDMIIPAPDLKRSS